MLRQFNSRHAMKKTTHTLPAFARGKIVFACAIILIAGLSACDDDNEDPASPVTVQFAVTERNVPENSGETVIALELNKPASNAGYIDISVTSAQLQRFNTLPVAIGGIIKLPVAQGQSGISFKMIPNDNTQMDGNASVEFKVEGTSDGLIAGTPRSTVITLTDDETTVQANFLLNAGHIRENKAEGLDVVIMFNGFAKAPGTIAVKFESANGIYGADFITEPAAVNGEIVLDVPKDIEYAFFRMLPVNNQSITGDRVVNFTIHEATGGLSVGAENKLEMIIMDDESYPVATVSDIRKMYIGELIILPNTLVSAVITSVPDNVYDRRIFIEDQTGGIAIRLLFENDFKRGDLILINMGYGLLKETDGILEVQQVSEADKIGEEQPNYDFMTLEELYNSTADHEGRLVLIHGVHFTDADNMKVMRGDHAISDGTRSIMVRTLDHASFANQIIPGGDYIVRGILTEVNGSFVLYPQIFGEDVVENKEYNWP